MSAVPILPGFHPDPTICRVGGDFYLATSSFEYFPGVPLFHSRDLLRWEPIGHALTRPTQLTVEAGREGASKGIYAPTLRHDDGRFWLITTNMNEIRRGHMIVHADDPAGPWSDPVYTAGAIGIDPDLVWDAEGACYLTWCDLLRHGISQAQVDPLTGELLTEPEQIWQGSGLANTEGPHLYQRGEWWYLLVAEGGTHTGHTVSVARSRSVSGPFEAHPNNPVLSHRSTSAPVQAVGHADLVQLADGSWAAVHLGIRQRGTFPRFHVLGRETFLIGVDWIDGWPVFDEDRFSVEPAETAFADPLTGPVDLRWVAPGQDPATFVRSGADGLTLAPEGDRAVLCARIRDHEWTATVQLLAGAGGLVVRIDDEHWFGIVRCGDEVEVRLAVGPTSTVLATSPVDGPQVLALDALPSPPRSFRAGPDRLRAGIVVDGAPRWLAEVDGRYVSTEVAGGFTGRMLGLAAEGQGATFRSVSYSTASSGTNAPSASTSSASTSTSAGA